MKRIFTRSLGSAASRFATCGAISRAYSTRYFTDTHEWLEHESGEATIGVTTYAQENLGDVVFVSLPQVGDTVSAKDVVGEVESVKATSNVYSPLTGTVSSVNERLADEPGLINHSPEQEGWLVKVQCASLPDGLMNEEQYKKFIE